MTEQTKGEALKAKLREVVSRGEPIAAIEDLRMARDSVRPYSLHVVLDHLRTGGAVMFRTAYTGCVIKQKDIDAWTKAGYELLREDGEGYRLQKGKQSSVYLIPGLLRYA